MIDYDTRTGETTKGLIVSEKQITNWDQRTLPLKDNKVLIAAVQGLAHFTCGHFTGYMFVVTIT